MYWYKVSLIQIGKLNRTHHKVPQRCYIIFQWHLVHVSDSRTLPITKLSLQGSVFVLTNRENLTLQMEPHFLLTSTVFLTIWSEFLSLCWFHSLPKWGSALNCCFLGQSLNRGFSSTLEWDWPPGMCSRKGRQKVYNL